ncbi:AfsR/SARP family transcriptional regulator [Streptomyces coeruleoprunus]|uniref:AfsR/SARP family transcriptional regulator n=1 Tax=Streptomyces coeruleoprunus TaxID=285563 RepID=A0ABV9XMY6_9ACTN
MLHIEVLGPLDVRVHGVSVVPTAGKPRQLLALLAQHAGRIVPVPTLVDELWGDDVPRSVSTTMQTYVLQLRRKIGGALAAAAGETGAGPGLDSKDVLSTCYGGYRLAAPERPSDAARFEQLAAQGATALEAGDARRAAAVLGRALELWQGDPLADVPVGRVLAMEVLALTEARARARELRIEADLRLGRHAALVGELRVLTAREPLHEGHCAQLMLALSRSGHPWRALEAFQRLRAALRDELGVEPSPRLQALHQQILTGAAEHELPVAYERFAS